MTDTPSLHAAITTANATPDTILFANSITLAGPLPAITNTYTIDGDNFILDGGNAHRGFIMIGGAANPTIMDLTIQNVLAQGGDGGDAQDVRGGSGGGGLGAGGAIYAGSFAGPTVTNVTFTNCVATGGGAPIPAGGTNSGGGGGGGLGGTGGVGSGAGGNGGGGGGGGYLEGNTGSPGVANVGGAGGANGGGAGASTGVAAAPGSYGGGGGGASAANNAAGVSGAGGYGGGGGGGSSRNTLVSRDGAMGGFGAGGGGGGRTTGIGGTSVFGGATGENGAGNQGGQGGGGAGLGGAIFTDSSSTLTIMTMVDPFTGSAVNPGTGFGAPTTSGLDIFVASGGNCRLFIQAGAVALANPIESDALSAAGGLEKLGPGILNFSGLTNTYRGTTTVTAGTLQFDADANLGNATLLTLNGGTLEPTVSLTSTKTTSITAPSFINTGAGVNFTLNGTISGASGFTKIGTGTFIPTAANVAYSGITTIDAGIVQVGADNNLGTGSLVLNGGTYEVTASFPSSRLISITNPSVIQVTGGATTLTQNGVVSSTAGSLDKTGAGTLEFTAVNTYTVPTTVTTGTILLSGAGTLGNAGDLTLTGGGLTIAPGAGTKTIGALNGAGTGINLNNNILQIASGSYGGAISGSGGITKYGVGTLSLTNVNSFTGQSTITGGILELSGAGTLGNSSPLDIISGSFEIAPGAGVKTIGTLTGAGAGIHLNNNNLNVPDGTFTGPISGTGRINKTTAGTLTLGGASTYSGGTEILAGTLIVGADNHLGTGDLILMGGVFQPSASFTTSKGISITGASTINIAGGIDLTVNGAVSGAAALLKSGGGTLTVGSGANTYTGLTSLVGGRLVLNNSAFGGVTMSPGTFVEGVGTLNGDLFNDGTVSPGFSIGTIVVTGNYTQTANGTLLIEIHPSGNSDHLIVGGTADLAGTLLLDPLAGVYNAGTIFTVVTAGTINNDFDQFLETHPLDFIHYIQGNQVFIEVLFSQAVLPVDFNNLTGNAKSFADYLFCSDASFLPPGEDLRVVINDLVNLPSGAFVEEMTLLTPQQFRALPLTTLQNSMRVADAMLSRYDSHDFDWLVRCRERAGAALPHDFWFQPIGYYYKQNERKNEFGFNVRSFGWSSGVSLVFWDHVIVGASLNYLYSDLHWALNAGKADLNMFSLGPSIGYLSKNWFANLAVLGGRTFYDVDRNIRFSSIDRNAHNDHKSWDVQAVLSGGYRLSLSRIVSDFYLQPHANISVINVFESGYQESGANSLDLSVENKNSSFFKSLVDARLIKDLHLRNICLTPSIRVGWLRYVSLTDGDYTARLYDQETCHSHFTVETNDKSTDQLVLGGELLISSHDHLSFELKYEANIGDHFYVQEGTVRLQWDF